MSRFIYCYAECHYDECRYAKCHNAECRCPGCLYADCRYVVAPTILFMKFLKSVLVYVILITTVIVPF